MDHIPRPSNAEDGIEFPYYSPAVWRWGTGIERYGYWRHFAEEMGLPEAEFENEPRSLDLILEAVQVPFIGLLRFFQTWLYFGSLAIFLECDDFNLFIKRKEHEGIFYNTVLDTSRLMGIVQNWVNKMIGRFPTLGAAEWEKEWRRRDDLLRFLNRPRGGVAYLKSGPGGGEEGEYLALLGLSVELLASVMRQALERVLLETGGDPGNLEWPDSGSLVSNHVGDLLCHRGWCSTDLRRLGSLLGHGTLLCFAIMIPRRLENPHMHYRCVEECIAYQIYSGAYQPKHTHHCSSSDAAECKGVGLALNAAENILSTTDSFPVVRLWMDGSKPGGTKNRSFEAVSFEPGMDYVAISHVWSDGLGDEKGNQVLACQYDRLAQMIDQVMNKDNRIAHLAETSETPSSPNDREKGSWSPFFWLDTICVPHQRETRRLACARMAETYRLAHTVLVLDAELQDWRYCQGNDAEALLRIIISGWMTRVWTLSEGILAKKLVFKFADYYFDLSIAGKRIADREESSMMEQLLPMASSLYHKLNRFRAFSTHSRMVNRILRAFDWIKMRQTSHVGDDIIAVAVLLQMEHIEKLYDVPYHMWRERMKLFLKTLHHLPPSLPFHIGPKMLGEKGFQWAPASLNSTGSPSNGLIGKRRKDASLDNQKGGFVYSYPGLIIQVDWEIVSRRFSRGRNAFRILLRGRDDPSQQDFVMGEEWWEILCHDYWGFRDVDEGSIRKTIGEIGRTQPAVIIMAEDFVEGWGESTLDRGDQGILVSHVQEDENGVFDCQYGHAVVVRKLSQISGTMDESGCTLRTLHSSISTNSSDIWGSYQRTKTDQVWRIM